MLDEFSTANGPADIIGIDLHTIWKVQADQTYDIQHDFSVETSKRLHQLGGVGLVALRTIKGAGKIHIADNIIDIHQDSLVILHWNDLLRYHCDGTCWHFWWFEFTVTGPILLPIKRLLHIAPIKDEIQSIERAYLKLKHHSVHQRRLAAISVLSILYQWIAQVEAREHPYQETIDHVIDLMHNHLSPIWTVTKMADAANMSVRNFRKVFYDITGQSPKVFYGHLRLSIGKELMLRKGLSVSGTSQHVGYSSPFHFSREFKKMFGIAPSKIHRRM